MNGERVGVILRRGAERLKDSNAAAKFENPLPSFCDFRGARFFLPRWNFCHVGKLTSAVSSSLHNGGTSKAPLKPLHTVVLVTVQGVSVVP